MTPLYFQLLNKKNIKGIQKTKYIKINDANLSKHKNSLETLCAEFREAHSIKTRKKSGGKRICSS